MGRHVNYKLIISIKGIEKLLFFFLIGCVISS